MVSGSALKCGSDLVPPRPHLSVYINKDASVLPFTFYKGYVCFPSDFTRDRGYTWLRQGLWVLIRRDDGRGERRGTCLGDALHDLGLWHRQAD